MKNILLIEELLPSDTNLITEATQDGKNLWLSGIFMQSQIKNRNGRNYPLSEISSAVNTAKQRITEANGIFGELDHPQTLSINLDRISHVITEMWMNGNNAMGKARLLSTPCGLIAQELVKSGVKLGVSSRGAGSVTEGGDVSGFNFVTVDLVAQPSAPEAYPSSIYESLMNSKNGHNIVTLAEQLKHDQAAQKYFKKEILRWINNELFKTR